MTFIIGIGFIGVGVLLYSSYRVYKTSVEIQKELVKTHEHYSTAIYLLQCYIETQDTTYLNYAYEELQKIESARTNAKR